MSTTTWKKRRRIGSAGALVALGLAACIVRGERTMPLTSEEASSPRSELRRSGVEIVSYVLASGELKACASGKARKLLDPSGKPVIRITCAPGADGSPGEDVTLPVEAVGAVVLSEANVGLSILATAGVVVASALGAIALLVALILLSSCPLIYSWDGKQYVLDGEPYGGATMAAFERTDSSELRHLIPEGGRYRLLIANEMDETQRTNSLELVEVDAPPGALVVMDLGGAPHAFKTLVPPASARDEGGRDLVSLLAETDRRAWTADLDELAARLPLDDTRSHLFLEFDRPAGNDPVYLVSGASTALWGATMLRTLLGLHGSRVDELHAAVNASPALQEDIRRWGEREELFTLGVQVQVGDRWERRGTLPGGGPLVPELRAVPLDLRGVEGPRIRIRLDPPIGFWSFDSFRLASGEHPIQVARRAPLSARDHGGRDVTAELAAQDGRYLVQPRPGDFAEVQFAASPLEPGLRRTLFARTRGWYEVHTDRSAPPDEAALQRLASEPGWLVQRAMSELAELKRTGVVRGVNPAMLGRPALWTRPDPFAR